MLAMLESRLLEHANLTITRMAKEMKIGTHLLRIEGDTVLTRYVGVPKYEDICSIHAEFDRVLDEQGRLFVINDMHQSGLPSAETRRFIATWGATHAVAGVANFGASLTIRVLQELILRAMALVGKKPPVEVVHCDSEADAFAWIAVRRRQLL